MKSKVMTDLNNTYEEIAHIHQDMLSHLDDLHINALSYVYIDFEHQTMVMSGTELKSMQHLIEHNLHQDVAHRLREHAHAWHAEFAKENQALMDPMNLFEPMPEPTLTELEDKALSLRVQWFKNDEIADAMQCSLKDKKALFISIKEKHHRLKIPKRVYSTQRKKLFPELFAQ